MTDHAPPQIDYMKGRFYAWCTKNGVEPLDILFQMWRSAWMQGGRDSLLRSSELAYLTPRLEELARLFRLEEDSYSWAMSNALAEERAIVEGD